MPRHGRPLAPARRAAQRWRHLMEFLFPRRIARLSYLMRSLALSLPVALLVNELESATPPFNDGPLLFSLAALVICWTAFVVAPRCRNLAMSAWLSLLVFVPGWICSSALTCSGAEAK